MPRYSRAGKQNVMDPRNSLVFGFARLVFDINPKTMMFENVPDIVNMVTPDGDRIEGGLRVYRTA